MKKIILSTLFIFCFLSQYGQTPITLTFQAKDSLTQNALALYSVNVKNLSENCDTTLFDAVSVLNIVALWPVGIDDPALRDSESFVVMQNVPNPFMGTTLIRICLKHDGELKLAVYDNQGNKLSQFQNLFVKGWHLFGISTGASQLLFLNVSDNTARKTIKIISTGASHEGDRISWKGISATIPETLKSSQDASGFIFYLGNQLQYTAHADGYHERILYDNPESSETYTFAMLPVSTPTIPTISTSPVTNITQTTATGGGNVTSDGGAFVTARGVCWSTTPNPTLANNSTNDGAGTGVYISYLNGLTPNTPYYIRSYAINSAGTAYGNELTFTTLSLAAPTVSTTETTNITQTTATSGGNVTSDGGDYVSARGVCWSTSPNPTTAGSHTTDGSGMGLFVSNLNGLTSNTPYYIRAYAINSVGTAYGSELTFTTLNISMPTVATTPVTNITQTTATSGGNVTSDGGATVTTKGVCWSTSPNPTTAGNHTTDGSGTGSFVSNLTGLTPNTPYYVCAYATNSAGTAYGNELTFTTLAATFTCGSSFTINHVAGAIAPVNKTVIYGTVTNIPGETSKCWITSNLGSDHQATAVNDATEASAGWYWQFNRKQGYKHTGTVRTPNTPWINNISENSDWLPANDPCTLELGAGWRLPTSTEWTNVEAIGNWTNWTGPWECGLKLHAAGQLITGGSLNLRGSHGRYWSSTQSTADWGWDLIFGSGFCNMYDDDKETGITARCLKE